MSVNTAIKEGGNHYSFGPVDYLRVESDNGQYALWVPESERQLSTKSIYKNGVYQASADGVYGWSSVYVNVPTQDGVSGEGDDGEQHYVSPDPETGELLDEVIPSSIQVITPPNFIGPYGDGAYIDFTGLTVKAYDAHGNEVQDVPFGELLFPVTVARYNEGDEYGQATSSLLPSGGYVPLYSSAVCSYELNNPTYNYSHVLGIVGIVGARGGLYKPIANVYTIIFASDTQGEANYFYRYLVIDSNGNTSIQDYPAPSIALGNSYTYDGKTVYWNYAGLPSDMEIAGVRTIPTYDAPVMNGVEKGQIAWTMVYGDTEITGNTDIPVQWQRPGDGHVLETSFGIIVTSIGQG